MNSEHPHPTDTGLFWSNDETNAVGLGDAWAYEDSDDGGD